VFLIFYTIQGIASQGISTSAELPPLSVASDTHQQDTVIVYYRETLGGAREALEGASLIIFSDGYIQVHRPPYMKQAGSYKAYLEPNALDNLWHMLTDRKILEFDSTLVHNKIQEVKQQQRALLAPVESISDAPATLIEIYPNRYKSPEMFESGDSNAKKNISWRGLKWTAEHFSSIDEIQYLISVQQQLQVIMQRTDLKKLNE
jgi:hypothetical protein